MSYIVSNIYWKYIWILYSDNCISNEYSYYWKLHIGQVKSYRMGCSKTSEPFWPPSTTIMLLAALRIKSSLSDFSASQVTETKGTRNSFLKPRLHFWDQGQRPRPRNDQAKAQKCFRDSLFDFKYCSCSKLPKVSNPEPVRIKRIRFFSNYSKMVGLRA